MNEEGNLNKMLISQKEMEESSISQRKKITNYDIPPVLPKTHVYE